MNDYNNKYEWFEGLLMYFLEDTYSDNMDDIDTIKRYINDAPIEPLYYTIQEGKEILALDNFPFTWIQQTANKFPFNDSNKNTVKDYYNWLTWVIDTLEEEARKAGKIR